MTAELVGGVARRGFFPQWDPAKYGVAGVRLAAALRHLDPLAFLAGVNRLGLWPPLYPLAETPAFLLFGDGYRVAAGFVGALDFLTALAAFWAGRWVAADGTDELRPSIAGALTALAVLVCPIGHLFGTLSMLEVPGALLVFVAVGAYARSLATGRREHWRWACIAATALFFLKYNYGLLWLAPLALHEAWRAAGDEEGALRHAARRAGERLRAIDLRRPWTWFLIAYAALLVAIAVTGGWELPLADRTFHVQAVGNPLYVLYLLVVFRALVVPGRRRALLARFRALGERARTAAAWIGLPIAVWFLLPPHLKEFCKFVENRAAGPPAWSLGGLVFYPRAFVAAYSPYLAVGVAVLFLAAWPLAELRRLPPARRLVALALAVGAAALVLHPDKLPRFLFTVAPLVWLGAAATVAAGLRSMAAAAGRWRAAAGVGGAAALAVAALLVWVAVAGGVDAQRLARDHAERSVPARRAAARRPRRRRRDQRRQRRRRHLERPQPGARRVAPPPPSP